jgi:hypothetical protein
MFRLTLNDQKKWKNLKDFIVRGKNDTRTKKKVTARNNHWINC